MSDVLLHNPRCSTSRAALALVRERRPDIAVIDYLATPPGVDELIALCRAAAIPATALVRAKEPLFSELGLSLDDQRDDHGWCDLMHRHPILIQRPVLRVGARAVIGRPAERVLELLP